MEQLPIDNGTPGLKVAAKPSQGLACPKGEMHPRSPGLKYLSKCAKMGIH